MQTEFQLRLNMRLIQPSATWSVSGEISNTIAPTTTLIGFSLGSGVNTTSATQQCEVPSMILTQNWSLQFRGNHSRCSNLSCYRSESSCLRIDGSGKGQCCRCWASCSCILLAVSGALPGGKAQEMSCMSTQGLLSIITKLIKSSQSLNCYHFLMKMADHEK